jgi:hypothetical protein
MLWQCVGGGKVKATTVHAARGLKCCYVFQTLVMTQLMKCGANVVMGNHEAGVRGQLQGSSWFCCWPGLWAELVVMGLRASTAGSCYHFCCCLLLRDRS